MGKIRERSGSREENSAEVGKEPEVNEVEPEVAEKPEKPVRKRDVKKKTPRDVADEAAEAAYDVVATISPEKRTALLMALMQQHLTDQANSANNGLAEDFRKAESADAGLRFMNDTLLTELARARGQRLVDSSAMDEAVRAARAKVAERRETSLAQRLKNVFISKGAEDTKIIKEHEKLLTEVAGLTGERTRLAGEVSALEHKRMELAEKATKEAQQIIATTSERMQDMENRSAELRAEINDLEKYKNKLEKDPKIVVLRSTEVLDKKILELERKKMLDGLAVSSFSNIDYFGKVRDVAVEIQEYKNREVLEGEFIKELQSKIEDDNSSFIGVDKKALMRALIPVARGEIALRFLIDKFQKINNMFLDNNNRRLSPHLLIPATSKILLEGVPEK